MLKKFDLDTIIKGTVAVGIMLVDVPEVQKLDEPEFGLDLRFVR